jgi:hypothetical protein
MAASFNSVATSSLGHFGPLGAFGGEFVLDCERLQIDVVGAVEIFVVSEHVAHHDEVHGEIEPQVGLFRGVLVVLAQHGDRRAVYIERRLVVVFQHKGLAALDETCGDVAPTAER